MWMTESLIQPTGRDVTLEEVGCAYFEELTSRFFFQQSNKSPKLFIMHDLIHDLAESFAGEFYCRVNIGEENSICNKTRHISYIYDQCDMENQINNSKALRTFLQLPYGRGGIFAEELSRVILSDSMCKLLLSNCKCLRVLSLFDLDFCT